MSKLSIALPSCDQSAERYYWDPEHQGPWLGAGSASILPYRDALTISFRFFHLGLVFLLDERLSAAGIIADLVLVLSLAIAHVQRIDGTRPDIRGLDQHSRKSRWELDTGFRVRALNLEQHLEKLRKGG
jgi:hypothetical protein